MATPPKIVIIGAGFGGLWAARALRRKPVDVTLIDRNNFHTFLPLLYQVGAAELEPFAIARPVRTIVRGQENLQFLHATARRLDLDRKLVHTDRGVYAWDYLILAPGTVAFDFGIPGVRRHAFPLKTLEDGIALRSHILARFEAALHVPDPGRRAAILRFLIIGGGPTGVEFAGALSELIRGPLRKDYPFLRDEASVVLVEAADRLLTGLPESLSTYARRRLERMGVDVQLDTLVERVEGGRIGIRRGEERREIVGETVAWTAGVRGAPTDRWGLPTGRDGRIETEPTLQVPGHPDVFAVGDIARTARDGEPLPMLAQVAMQGGERAAENVVRLSRGDRPQPFRYRDKGLLAVIGRNAAVARVAGRNFTGFPAWVLWLGVHIVYLIGFRNRFAVLLNWAWDYVFFERVARILIPLRLGAPRWPDDERSRSGLASVAEAGDPGAEA